MVNYSACRAYIRTRWYLIIGMVVHRQNWYFMSLGFLRFFCTRIFDPGRVFLEYYFFSVEKIFSVHLANSSQAFLGTSGVFLHFGVLVFYVFDV